MVVVLTSLTQVTNSGSCLVPFNAVSSWCAEDSTEYHKQQYVSASKGPPRPSAHDILQYFPSFVSGSVYRVTTAEFIGDQWICDSQSINASIHQLSAVSTICGYCTGRTLMLTYVSPSIPYRGATLSSMRLLDNSYRIHIPVRADMSLSKCTRCSATIWFKPPP